MSTERLREEADIVVIADVVRVAVSTERSHLERGFGNYDWAIDLTLRISAVEKGSWARGEELVARCFRIKSRKSVWEFFTPSGNHPITGVGVAVRAYLYRRDAVWRVVFPKGLQSASGDTPLTCGPEMRALAAPRHTYWLPMEVWALGLIGLSFAYAVVFVWGRYRRKRRIQCPWLSK